MDERKRELSSWGWGALRVSISSLIAVALAGCAAPGSSATTAPASAPAAAAGPRQQLLEAFSRSAGEPPEVGFAAIDKALVSQAASERRPWMDQAQTLANRCAGAEPKTALVAGDCYAAGCMFTLRHADDGAADAFFEQLGRDPACQGWSGERLGIKAFARASDGSTQSALVLVVPSDS